MSSKAMLEGLPDELLILIFSYLSPLDTIALHRTCSKLHAVTRNEDQVWRSHCLSVNTSASPVSLPPFLARSPRPSKTTITIAPVRNGWTKASEYTANGEDGEIDWYLEYKRRNAPLLYTSFTIPQGSEVRNVTVSDCNSPSYALAALDDASICLFSLSRDNMGKVLGRSRSDLLTGTGSRRYEAPRRGAESVVGRDGHHERDNRGVAVEGVSVNGNKGYFAIGSHLVEVDLNTLQRVARHRFPFSITTLSATNNDQPLAIGTTLTLHLHDTRSPGTTDTLYTGPSTSQDDRLDFTSSPTPPGTPPPPPYTSSLSASLVLDREERLSRDHLLHTPTAFLQPSPLAIQHSPMDQASGYELYVAGRFPSILCYDRRLWPKIRGNIHSGARLSGLTVIPCAPIGFESDATAPSKYTLVACGEYGGRGTLELYNLPYLDGATNSDGLRLPQPPQVQSFYNTTTSSGLKNRQTASRSKVISVAYQGTCLVIGDGDGRVKMMEGNGIRQVRRWSFDGDAQVSHNNDAHSTPYHLKRPSEGGCVTRILPTHKNSVNTSGLLLQVGDGIGYLGVDPVTPELWKNGDEVPSTKAEVQEEKYKHMMRKALEQQAAGVRFMEGLGL